MSEPAQNKSIISPENQPTVIAVVFILALLSLVFNFYNHKSILEVAGFYGKVSVMLAQKSTEATTEAGRIDGIEKRIAALEAEAAAMKGGAAPAAPVVAAPATTPATTVKAPAAPAKAPAKK